MTKLSKLRRSNLAHKRLTKQHSKKASTNVIAWIKSGYHNDVLKHQTQKNRLLTNDEKKRIYKNNEFYAYN